MYERFTDRAQKTMRLANQEAQRLYHEYIGTEHILLGLLGENCTAVEVIRRLEIDPRKIRLEVEKLVQSGPEIVSMGKLPQTPRAKKVIEYAFEAAREMNHNYVGTEHLLLGLIREEEGMACKALRRCGLQYEKTRDAIIDFLRDQSKADQVFQAHSAAPTAGPTLPQMHTYLQATLDSWSILTLAIRRAELPPTTLGLLTNDLRDLNNSPESLPAKRLELWLSTVAAALNMHYKDPPQPRN